MPYRIEQPDGFSEADAAIRAIGRGRHADGIINGDVTAQPGRGIVATDGFRTGGGEIISSEHTA